MKKDEIRKQYRSLRKALTPQEVASRSNAIHSLFFKNIPVHRFSIIHIFLSIAENNEPNTKLIIDTLQKDFPAELYISKSLENGEMLHVRYTPHIKLEKNKWGIEEPSDLSSALDSAHFFQQFKNEEILILIPLMVFDKQGNRVGYGKGYYDRFLADSSANNCTKIGLSLFEAIPLISDTNTLDIKMDYCISPQRMYVFNN